MRFTLEEACELVRARAERARVARGRRRRRPGAVRVRLTKAGELQMISEPFDDDIVHAAVMETQARRRNPAHDDDDPRAPPLPRRERASSISSRSRSSRAGRSSERSPRTTGSATSARSTTKTPRSSPTLANHVGTALENGRLIERLRTEVAQKEHQALHDTLTGLGNRDLFAIRADAALRESQAGGWQRRGAAHRPRRLQGRQRHARPRQRRPPAPGGRRPASARAARTRRRSPASAATSSRCSSRRSATPRGRAASRLACRPCCSSRTSSRACSSQSSAAIGIAVAPDARHRRLDAAQVRRHRDVQRQGQRRRRASRSTTPTANRHSPRRLTLAARAATAIENGELEVLLPAEGRPPRRRDRRRRGTRPLAPPRARHDPARRVRRDRRDAPGSCAPMTTLVLAPSLEQCARGGERRASTSRSR